MLHQKEGKRTQEKRKPAVARIWCQKISRFAKNMLIRIRRHPQSGEFAITIRNGIKVQSPRGIQ
jgi:hypothetical protein